MHWFFLGPIAALVISHAGVKAGTGTTDVQCMQNTTWMNNALGQSPCLALAIVISDPSCMNSDQHIPTVPAGGSYPPQTNTVPCLCSEPVFSMFEACARCQHWDSGTMTWGKWTGSCPKVFASYQGNVPDDTQIPSWANLDIQAKGTFDLAAASNAAAGALSTTSSSFKSTVTTSATFSPNSSPLATSSPDPSSSTTSTSSSSANSSPSISPANTTNPTTAPTSESNTTSSGSGSSTRTVGSELSTATAGSVSGSSPQTSGTAASDGSSAAAASPQSHKTPTKTIVGAVIGVIGGLLALAAGILIMKRRRLHRVRHGGSDVNIDGDSSPGYNETADPFGMHAPKPFIPTGKRDLVGAVDSTPNLGAGPPSQGPTESSATSPASPGSAEAPALAALVELLYQRQLRGEAMEHGPPSYGSEPPSIRNILSPSHQVT